MPHVTPDRIRYLIQRVRSKQATPEEKRELERFSEWARQDEALFHSLLNDEKEMIRQEMFKNINTRISTLGDLRFRKGFFAAVSSWQLKTAASLSLLAVMFFLFYWYSNQNFIEVRAQYGEHVHVVLPDDSEVILNGNSVIRYARSWKKDEDREVWLEGEGFFDVTHTGTGEKFTVHTRENMQVQVLGTKFNVKVRRAVAQIMLEEGKVRVDLTGTDAAEPMILKPGEMATLARHQLTKERVNPSLYSAWKEHKLYFDQTPLRDVMHMLEDTYGYTVTFEDQRLADRRLSGQLYAKQGADILSAIKESFGISITVRDNHVIVHAE